MTVEIFTIFFAVWTLSYVPTAYTKKLTFKNKPTLRYIFTGVKGVTGSPGFINRPLKHSIRLEEKGISYYFKSTLFEVLTCLTHYTYLSSEAKGQFSMFVDDIYADHRRT